LHASTSSRNSHRWRNPAGAIKAHLVGDLDGGTAAVAGDAAQLARPVDALENALQREPDLRHAKIFCKVILYQ